jgi:hypothetical protein
MVLSTKESKILESWNAQLKGQVAIRLVLSEDRRSEQFESFCDELLAGAPIIGITRIRSRKVEPPALLLGDSLWFYAIPYGKELEPFLDALAITAGAGPDLPETHANCLKGIERELNFKIFISPQCHFCPNVVRQIAPIPLIHAQCSVKVIDAQMFPELAEPFNIKAVPTVMLNDNFRWTGQAPLDEILSVAGKDDPSRLEPEALKAMLKEGQASNVAQMMLESNQIFPGFLDLLRHPEWSVRLGALVAVEEIADANRGLARTILEPLWKSLADQDASVQGDIIYLIGELGQEDATVWTGRLQSLLQKVENNEQLLELVEETLSKLIQ